MRKIIPTYYGYKQDDLAPLYYASGAQAFIDEHRRTDADGQLHLERTCQSFGAIISRAALSAHGRLFASKNGFTIKLADDLTPEQERFVCGHEIGHIVLLGYQHYTRQLPTPSSHSYDNHPARDDFVEAFCDYFAGKLLQYDYPTEVPSVQGTQKAAEQLDLW